MNPEKLAKLQESVRIGGKGTPRRKVKKVVKSAAADDKKLTAALKKFNLQPIGGIEEVNFFKNDGHILHFAAPKGASLHIHMKRIGNLCISRADSHGLGCLEHLCH